MKLLICPMCHSRNVELDSGGVSGKYSAGIADTLVSSFWKWMKEIMKKC